jgi:MYXO-CTERM domain-containing protein
MRSASQRVALFASILLATPSLVHAQAVCPPDSVGCHLGDVDFTHRDALFDDIMFDTGWVPAGSPLQLHFALYVGGSTQVDMGGTAVTAWPPALDVGVAGRPGTGRIAMNYGIEVIADIRIDVEVGGVRYQWEGPIPLGDFPRDLRVAAEAMFDPFLLPPSTPRPISVSDMTERVTLYEYDITDSLIPIPGIGGGIRVDAVASLDTAYQTERIEIVDAIEDILTENQRVLVRPAPGLLEFGGSKDLEITPHGSVFYNGVITLYPTLFIELLGQHWDYVIADIPVPLVDLTSETDFNTDTVHVPLPDIDVDPTSLDFGIVVAGETAEELLMVANEGEEPLIVTVAEPAAPFTASQTSFTVPPRSTIRLAVTFHASGSGPVDAMLVLDSNDPDEPSVGVRLHAEVDGAPMTMADGGLGGDAGDGYITDGGCGCRAASGGNQSGILFAFAALAGVLVVRRRVTA